MTSSRSFREFAMMHGMIDVSRQSLMRRLKQGHSVAIGARLGIHQRQHRVAQLSVEPRRRWTRIRCV
jgi:hypothetical protein